MAKSIDNVASRLFVDRFTAVNQGVTMTSTHSTRADVIVIGGLAGLTAARELVAAGRSVAVPGPTTASADGRSATTSATVK
jgi:monoamine oxidase